VPAAGGVLAIAAQLDLVAGLLAVLAAVFPESTVRLDEAFTRWMRTLR
jgi:hypothetical protein